MKNNYFNPSESAVYVGTYKKYNEGSLSGKWLNLSDYNDKDEFLNACYELHKDETEPELMFQDWENIPERFISECSISESFFELIALTNNFEDIEADAFFTWLDVTGEKMTDPWSTVEKFKDQYQGEYDSEEDFAEEFINECYNLDEFALRYFDYEKFARDLFLDGYYFENGFVFNLNA